LGLIWSFDKHKYYFKKKLLALVMHVPASGRRSCPSDNACDFIAYRNTIFSSCWCHICTWWRSGWALINFSLFLHPFSLFSLPKYKCFLLFVFVSNLVLVFLFFYCYLFIFIFFFHRLFSSIASLIIWFHLLFLVFIYLTIVCLFSFIFLIEFYFQFHPLTFDIKFFLYHI
jgi:hypothetical protein